MECPNCAAHIGRFDLSPNCRSCGVNIFYSQQERLLSNDAKRCELEFAAARIFSRRLKTAFIGGFLQISRMVLTVLCVGALFVPFASVHIKLPLFDRVISMWGYGLYKAYSDGSLGALPSFAAIDLSADIARKSILLIASMAFLLLVAVGLLAAELLSFVNIRRSCVAMAVISSLGVVGSAVSGVFSLLLARADAAFPSGIAVAEAGLGALAAAACFAGMLAINILMLKKKIAPVYDELDLRRVAVHRRVKAGEITYDDLPLPVFDTENREETVCEPEDAEEKSVKERAGVVDE